MRVSSQPDNPDIPVLTRALAAWFRKNQRPLPWRKTYTPYTVWVSEVMLQQTQVETVIPYYERFVRRFPTLDALATSEESEVLKLWSGLGYYNRARNFRRAAKLVVAQDEGQVPADYDRLLELPGVGRYMAGAIMSIAFDKRYAIVDGNVRRFLCRVHGWPDPKERDLWRAAGEVVRSGRPRVVNQAMMELGATVCTFRAPRCEVCPCNKGCIAHAAGTEEQIPAPRARPDTVRVHLYAIVDDGKRGLLMAERDGLWEFPTLTEPPAGDFEKVGTCRHTITHHRLRVDVYRGKFGRKAGYKRVRFEDVPVSSLTRKIHSKASGTEV